LDGQTYTSSGLYNYDTQTVDGCDSTAFLNLTINNSDTSETIITACDSYDWNGQTYTSSGLYNYDTQTVDGCDSTAYLLLTINNSSSSTDTQEHCDSYTWVDGITYTSSNNTATWLYQTVDGCDSLVTLDLTINNSISTVVTIDTCDIYVWALNGFTYTQSGFHFYADTTAEGCADTTWLDLTINYSTTGSTSATACDSYDWDGVTYTTSGAYTNVYTNSVGCDSTHTLNLTIDTSTTSYETVTACDTYTWGPFTLNSTGVYPWSGLNAQGCDSTAILDLTINNSTNSTDIQVHCDSYTWIDGITYTTSNNTAIYLYQTVDGCDSLVTLDLTIDNSITSYDTVSVCDSYSWNDSTYTQSGVYTYTGGDIINNQSFIFTGANSNIDTYIDMANLNITNNNAMSFAFWLESTNNNSPNEYI